jgi:hypothetical protein
VNRGGGDSGLVNRAISQGEAAPTVRIIRLGSGTAVAVGRTNATGMTVGCDVSWQHDMEHRVIPVAPCSQFVVSERCSLAIGAEPGLC